jgi:hypothetical protein
MSARKHLPPALPEMFIRSTNRKMQIVEYQTELFREEVVPAEETAFRLLKQFPPQSDAAYVAVPWTVLLNRHRKKKVVIRGLNLRRGVTVCQHIRFREIIPACLSIGIETLFTPHAELGQSVKSQSWLSKLLEPFAGLRNRAREQRETARRFQILACPHFAINGAAPAQKDLWFSFVGCNTHAARAQLFEMPVPGNCVIKQRKEWHFQTNADLRPREKKEYQELLARSRFSICPRGTGPGTLRFWESLQAGAIPVLISDALKLPDCFDWNSCIVRIAERDTRLIPKVLSQISPAREQQMRRSCLQASRQYSGENFVSCIRRHLELKRVAA